MSYGDKRDFPPVHIWHRIDKGGDKLAQANKLIAAIRRTARTLRRKARRPARQYWRRAQKVISKQAETGQAKENRQ